MKKTLASLLTLCVLLCTFALLFASCDQDGNPPQTDTATNNQNATDIPPHDHVWENGVCKICSQKGPYELTFVSNGDGTCYVSEIKTNISFESNFEIDIPQTSPDGDTVTAINCDPFVSHVPLVLAVQDFEEILSSLKEKVDGGMADNFNYDRFNAYYCKYSLSNCKDDTKKEELLSKYPITEITDIYALVEDATDTEKRWLSEYLWANIQYSPGDLVEDYTRLYTIANESSSENKEEILASLPKVPDNLGYHVTSLCFPNTINEIDFAWLSSCSRLEALNWPEQVTDIPDGTFDQFDNLLGNTYQNAIYIGNEQNPYLYLWKTADKDVTSASVHSNTKIIAASAFYRCKKLVSVTIPEGVTRIGKSAFHDCTALTNITIPNSITHIEESTFSGCTSLASITIPNSVTNIGKSAFHDCTGLLNVEFETGSNLSDIGERVFEDCTSLATITLPNSVTSIGSHAFLNCTSLASVTLSESTTSINDFLFYGCSSLTHITIPDSVTSIGISAFRGCIGLTDMTIPDNVTSIDMSAFYECTSLTSIAIPNSVTTLGYSAFYGCSSLTSIAIPSSVTNIDSWAFYGCSSLVNIVVAEENPSYYSEGNCIIQKSDKSLILGCKSSVIPNDVTCIGSAFAGCTSLTSIIIQKSVTSISSLAFYNCTNLTAVYYEGTPDEWTSITLDNPDHNPFTDVSVYYYSETQPTDEGDYWHYVNGVPTAWD